MSEVKTGWLWCVHTIGPDEVQPAPDFETAWKWCETVNAQVKSYCQLAGYGGELSVFSVPALWPWSAERHAEALPAAIADFAPRGGPITHAPMRGNSNGDEA